MTFTKALVAAKKKAKRLDEWVYVVLEAGEYDFADDFDMTGFYFGAEIVATVGPDGELEA